MTEEQIKHMRDRFLGWKLPEEFKPDNGVTYTAPHGCWSTPLTGTNLLDANQAEAMVRYMAEEMPVLNITDAMLVKALDAFYPHGWDNPRNDTRDFKDKMRSALTAAVAASK